MSARLESLLDRQRRAECRLHDAELAQATRTFTRAARMVTTPAGITIGIAWAPPAPLFSRDAESIQSALLEPRTARPITGWRRVLGFIWRAC